VRISDIWARAIEYSDDVTRNVRQLALGGVAVCWVLKGQAGLDDRLLWTLGLFVVFFTLDVLQGVFGFLIRRIWLYRMERKLHKNGKSIDGEVDQPRWIDSPSFVCFLLKVTALLAAYALLGLHIFFETSGSSPFKP